MKNHLKENINNKDKDNKKEKNLKKKGNDSTEPDLINSPKNNIPNIYINEQLYPLVRIFKNISPNNVIIYRRRELLIQRISLIYLWK